jgi:DnaJ-domain-containing protein 1
MSTARSPAEIQEELQHAQADLAQARETAPGLRRRIGERRETTPTDPAERAALIEAAEEQEALVDLLEARLGELMRELRGINAPGSVRLTSRPRAAPGRSSTH